MDTLTHTVLGAAVGEVVLGKKIGKKAMLLGALFSNVPDIDVVSNLFMHPVDALLAHRGFTHSFTFALIMIPLFSYWFMKIHKRSTTNFRDWLKLIGITWISHLLIDSLTSYGTGWFEPFSHYRVSFNTIFVADPIYTFPLLVSSIALLILNSKSKQRKAWSYGGLIISCLYLVFTFISKIHVDNVVEESMKKQNLSYNELMTTPTPLNAILWNSIAKTDKGYWIGFYSLFDKSKDVSFYFADRNDSLVKDELNTDRGKKLIRFSQDYYCITQKDNINYFHDLRFGQFDGWNKADAPFTFSYRLGQDNEGEVFLQRRRFQGSISELFSSLMERIKGR
jgi:inner membrane protein